jgi:hypothetical protein
MAFTPMVASSASREDGVLGQNLPAAALRGGRWDTGPEAGVFTLDLEGAHLIQAPELDFVASSPGDETTDAEPLAERHRL